MLFGFITFVSLICFILYIAHKEYVKTTVPIFKVGDILRLDIFEEDWTEEEDLLYEIIAVGRRNYLCQTINKSGYRGGRNTKSFYIVNTCYRKIH
jgi:hypothetical protein